ncbi:unnamed protein product [Arabidopsis halleri]
MVFFVGSAFLWLSQVSDGILRAPAASVATASVIYLQVVFLPSVFCSVGWTRVSSRFGCVLIWLWSEALDSRLGLALLAIFSASLLSSLLDSSGVRG